MCIYRYLESFNSMNVHHSVLTYDGIRMNQAGHLLVAAILLRDLGFDNRYINM
jgi:hypothetical protein